MLNDIHVYAPRPLHFGTKPHFFRYKPSPVEYIALCLIQQVNINHNLRRQFIDYQNFKRN